MEEGKVAHCGVNPSPNPSPGGEGGLLSHTLNIHIVDSRVPQLEVIPQDEIRPPSPSGEGLGVGFTDSPSPPPSLACVWTGHSVGR
jgi:hypothetical protein